MDIRALKKACNRASDRGRNLKAVIPVPLAGHPCDMKGIRKALGDSRAVIIEDAAHAFPSKTPEGMAGTLGDIGVFSFYATKTITTGEGGMVACRNPEYEKRMRLMRLHGIDREVWNRYAEDSGSHSWEYDVTAPGFKYNMPDLAAAIGRIQLKKAEKLLGMRRNLAERYSFLLSEIPGLELPRDAPGHAWHLYIIHTRNALQRNLLAEELEKNRIGSSVHFIPLHRMSYWKNTYGLNAGEFPVADNLYSRSLSLPLWPGLRRKDQDRISSVIRKFFRTQGKS
jgi:dTDP-4-amino-4,6-dideoxygalactose transaminase